MAPLETDHLKSMPMQNDRTLTSARNFCDRTAFCSFAESSESIYFFDDFIDIQITDGHSPNRFNRP